MFGQPLHFAIMGPSGAGKSTVVNAVKENFPGLELQKQLNYTTRKRKRGEEIESDYVHIDVDKYYELKAKGKYIGFRETEGVDNEGNPEVQNYGGTAPHMNNIVFITDTDGHSMLEKRSKEHGERIVSIFFDAAKDVCHERMVNSRNEEAANDRTKKYESFLSGKDNADYVIDASRPLEEVTMALYEILQSEMMTHSYPY